jgi:hypothetical protein
MELVVAIELALMLVLALKVSPSDTTTPIER